MKFTTRELVLLAVFGALWGVVEMSLGTVLKSLHVPMSGTVLAAIGLMIALIGRTFVPRAGSTLFIGVIAMILKLFSLGGIVIGPMVGIFMEALVAELVLTAGRRTNRWTVMLAGALGALWPMAQPFVTSPLLFGRSLTVVWLDLMDQGSRYLGLDPNAGWIVLTVMAAVHMAIGAVAGAFAWQVGSELHKRLGRTPQPASQPFNQRA